MARRYRIYDVFTKRALTGNPLAVVLDCAGLEPETMQGIAREFNLSETVFAVPADNPAYSARIRIFTPVSELPFAGHPTIGAAVCLAAERFGADSREQDAVIVLEEGIGPVRCGVRLNQASGFAEFDCPKLPRALGEPSSNAAIAAALNLSLPDIGFENHRPSVWSAGLPYHFVPVHDMAALATAQPVREAWTAAFGNDSAYLYTRETEGHEHQFRARMFAPMHGIDEDPATGSAVAALAGPVHHFDAPPDGEHVALVEQGYDMGRPSLIRLEMVVGKGALQTVRIGGDAVRLAEGVLGI
ncbi:MAG TPA: PhzF family phenazine biosynthesis protein [Afifellaceae bacterium]|nr:PhzF family phenazine biosynthesis protein [Afifellaceae bacterium]